MEQSTELKTENINIVLNLRWGVRGPWTRVRLKKKKKKRMGLKMEMEKKKVSVSGSESLRRKQLLPYSLSPTKYSQMFVKLRIYCCVAAYHQPAEFKSS